MPFAIPPPVQGLSTGDPNEILLGTGTSVPPGLESILEFNGVYLNDRSLIDTYVITSMSGLEDADLRDDREVNPQQHGETPFDAFYGGRTIVLTGYIRAYTLNKLRDMQQGLKQALAGLNIEKELIFHTFNRPLTDCLILCRKGAPLQMAETQPVDNYFRRDFMVTLRASNPRFLGLLQKQSRVMLGVIDEFSTDSSAQYIKTGSATIADGKVVPSGTTLVRWVRDDVPFAYSDFEGVIKYEPDATFTSSQIQIIGKYLDANNYLRMGVSANGSLVIYKFIDGSLTTATVGPVVPTRTGDTSYWIRARMQGSTITVEHSTTDPRMSTAGIDATLTHTLTGSDSVLFGEGINGKTGFLFVSGSAAWRFDDFSATPYNINSVITVATNAGNFSAQPEVKFSGPMTNPVLTNVQSGESLSIAAAIDQVNPYVVNIAERLMTDSVGNNVFSSLTFNSDWLELEPGDNQLSLNATGISPVYSAGIWYLPEVSLIYRDTWI